MCNRAKERLDASARDHRPWALITTDERGNAQAILSNSRDEGFLQKMQQVFHSNKLTSSLLQANEFNPGLFSIPPAATIGKRPMYLFDRRWSFANLNLQLHNVTLKNPSRCRKAVVQVHLNTRKHQIWVLFVLGNEVPLLSIKTRRRLKMMINSATWSPLSP